MQLKQRHEVCQERIVASVFEERLPARAALLSARDLEEPRTKSREREATHRTWMVPLFPAVGVACSTVSRTPRMRRPAPSNTVAVGSSGTGAAHVVSPACVALVSPRSRYTSVQSLHGLGLGSAPPSAWEMSARKLQLST